MYNDSKSGIAPQNNRAFVGLFLVVLGGIYLLNQLGTFFFFPGWVFSWPTLLIVIGIISGIKHNFQRPGAYVLIIIGSAFLVGHIIHITLYLLWPLIIIAIGMRMILGRNERWRRSRWYQRRNYYHNTTL